MSRSLNWIISVCLLLLIPSGQVLADPHLRLELSDNSAIPEASRLPASEQVDEETEAEIARFGHLLIGIGEPDIWDGNYNGLNDSDYTPYSGNLFLRYPLTGTIRLDATITSDISTDNNSVLDINSYVYGLRLGFLF